MMGAGSDLHLPGAVAMLTSYQLTTNPALSIDVDERAVRLLSRVGRDGWTLFVTNLQPRAQYEFRLRSTNEEGFSPPSASSGPLVAGM